MRYVSSAFQESTLLRGKGLEQFLGGLVRDGERAISWVELRPGPLGVQVWYFEAPDAGSLEFTDIYEFGADAEEPLATLSSPSEALSYAHVQLGASPDRWVNITVIGAEYEAFVRAGRPLRA